MSKASILCLEDFRNFDKKFSTMIIFLRIIQIFQNTCDWPILTVVKKSGLTFFEKLAQAAMKAVACW